MHRITFATMSSYLNELNESQLEAVEFFKGPMMIIAGPGSGKTRVLTYRIAHLMDKHRVDPFNILALTFTNKAAKNMRHRIETVFGGEARNLWMGTFHSVFARILRFEADKIGYPTNFSIYDTTDSKSLIKTIVKERMLNADYYKPNVVFNRISAAKNKLVSAYQYLQTPQYAAEDEASGKPKLGEIYRIYAERCFRAGAMDFDDLLMKMHELLVKNPEVLYKYQNRFQYLMVDEFQDTNMAQYQIVKLLSAINENIGVVGDDAQSIYAFRGASISNILNFQKDYPDLATFKLEQNYRSTKSIVTAANTIISNNKSQLEKTIWTDNGKGDPLKLFVAASDNEEGRLIADNIQEERLRNHFMNSDFAILYRTNAQSRAFEESLRKRNIPYRVFGGLSFYQRKEVKDLIAYLRLTVNHYDEEALRRIINYPTRGIGKTTIEKISLIAAETQRPFWDIIEHIQLHGFNKRVITAVSRFVVMIKSFAIMLDKKDAYDIANHIGQSTNIIKELYKDKSVEGLSRYENIQELLNSIKEYVDTRNRDSQDSSDSSLGTYLQEITLLTDADNEDEDKDRVSLMTVHAAKGLEFPVVYVVGMEEELFPSRLSVSSRDELEEERRLFYVAVTRAEKKVVMSHAQCRYRFGNLYYPEPSRFLDEISELDIKVIGHTGFRTTPRATSPWGNGGASQSTATSTKRHLAPIKKKLPKVVINPNFKAEDTSGLKEGNKVEHQKFGKGMVHSVEGTGKNRIATIEFHGFGRKRILLQFAMLQILE